MNTLVLHSYRRCPFAIRVRMTLEEKGLSYTLIEEDLSAPSAELLRLHPEGKVPLLIHDGEPIAESAVITEFLDETFPERSLRPPGAMDRARMRLWTHWCDHVLKPDLDAFKYEWKNLSGAEQSALIERLRAGLEKLESPVVKEGFLLGSALTLADIHVFPFYRQLRKANPEFSHLVTSAPLDRWLGAIEARPSFARAMAKSSGASSPAER